MSRGSEARRQKRALSKAGVALMDRVTIDSGALAAAVANGAPLVDLISYHVSEALARLDEQGADIVRGRTVATIGTHPDFPGGLTVEVKVDRRKLGAPDPCEARREEWRVQEEYAMSLQPGSQERGNILIEIEAAKKRHPECIE